MSNLFFMESENKKILEKKRSIARRKIHSLAFEIFVIFGLPAGIALGVGKFMDFSRGMQLALLLPAFSLSWFVFFRKFKKISGEINDLNQKIGEKELKNEQKDYHEFLSN